ncbi:hypothetical protein PInf_023844 [Phytophthora infestans]|nr:hypothetical protein PInf_023844 [Phytophthora infestans]
MKPDFGGISGEEDDDSGSDMSNNKPEQSTEVGSDTVDYEESADGLKPPSDSEESSDARSDSSVKRKDLPTIRSIDHCQMRKDHQRRVKEKPQPLNPREHRRQEAKTKVSHEDFGQHPRPTRQEPHDFGQRVYIPYEDLKQSIGDKVRDIQAQERYTIMKKPPEIGPPAQQESDPTGDRYLREGPVKASTILPANFAATINTTLNYPYRSAKHRNKGHNNGRGGSTHKSSGGGGGKDKRGNSGKNHSRKQVNNRPFDSDDDTEDNDDRTVRRQDRRDVDLLAVVTSLNPPVSLAAKPNVELILHGPSTLDVRVT